MHKISLTTEGMVFLHGEYRGFFAMEAQKNTNWGTSSISAILFGKVPRKILKYTLRSLRKPLRSLRLSYTSKYADFFTKDLSAEGGTCPPKADTQRFYAAFVEKRWVCFVFLRLFFIARCAHGFNDD